jgi:hypothetical protein
MPITNKGYIVNIKILTSTDTDTGLVAYAAYSPSWDEIIFLNVKPPKKFKLTSTIKEFGIVFIEVTDLIYLGEL